MRKSKLSDIGKAIFVRLNQINVVYLRFLRYSDKYGEKFRINGSARTIGSKVSDVKKSKKI